jgi:chromosome segregation ATPase
LLRDQQQLERDRWEELVRRQRQDLVTLREHDLELSNEVEFLRARLERVSTERDRAREAVQSAREKDLEAKLQQKEETIEGLRAKVTSLQDSLQRFALEDVGQFRCYAD